jgi:hypothetical protein
VVDFYYMPASRLRGDDPDRSVSNFHSCLAHYWCIIENGGYAHDWDQQRDYLLARSYELVRRDKAVQQIYRDAFLRRRSFRPGSLQLSDDVRDRVLSVVISRDKQAVRQELAKVFQPIQLSQEEKTAASIGMDHWLNAGVELFRRDGDDGIRTWFKDVEKYYKQFRRKSEPLVQAFLRVFAYESKVAFYHKFAIFWIGLLRWLEEHHGLSPASKRFMGIWHNQNQRVEIHNGRLPSGIVLPTGRQLWLPDGVSIDPLFGGRLMDGGAVEVVPDILCGQILSLHPISWILLARPDLCELVGSCIAAPRFDDAMKRGQVDGLPEYWRMVEAIFTAAYLYQVAREGNESRRNKRSVGGNEISTANVSISPGPLAVNAQLRDYVVGVKEKCACGGKYEYASTELPLAKGKTVTLPVICGSCRRPSELVTTQHDMEGFFNLQHKTGRKRRPPR